MRRQTTDICALVAIDKEKGCTSHDVVDSVRRITGERRVGHCGTLDPFATGLLIVGIGPATRLNEYLSDASKSYIATICFGIGTDTDDITGEALQTMQAPSELLDEGFAQQALDGMLGKSMQMPPKYSAKKIGGQKAYDLARKGEEVKLTEVEIEVVKANLVSIREERVSDCDCAIWEVEFEVSKGTYIRALARDLGVKLGCPACLIELRRTSIADIDVADAVSLDRLRELVESNSLCEAMIDPVAACGLASHEANDYEADKVSNGSMFRVRSKIEVGCRVAIVRDCKMLAIYEACEQVYDEERGEFTKLRAIRVIPGGVEGVR